MRCVSIFLTMRHGVDLMSRSSSKFWSRQPGMWVYLLALVHTCLHSGFHVYVLVSCLAYSLSTIGSGHVSRKCLPSNTLKVSWWTWTTMSGRILSRLSFSLGSYDGALVSSQPLLKQPQLSVISGCAEKHTPICSNRWKWRLALHSWF